MSQNDATGALKVESGDAPPVLFDAVTRSARETVALGRKLSRLLQPPCLALLEGDLGSGKTTLVKGIVAGLGAAREEEVTSPTFTLVHEYGPQPKVYHVDLYRIAESRELATLGLDDLMVEDATVLVEWGEKLVRPGQGPAVRVRLEHLEGGARRIRAERLEA